MLNRPMSDEQTNNQMARLPLPPSHPPSLPPSLLQLTDKVEVDEAGVIKLPGLAYKAKGLQERTLVLTLRRSNGGALVGTVRYVPSLPPSFPPSLPPSLGSPTRRRA